MAQKAPNAERMAIRRENLDRQIAHIEGIIATGKRRDPFTDGVAELTPAQLEEYRAHLASLRERLAAL